MVDVIKLRELGYDVDYAPDSQTRNSEHIVHQMFKGYKKLGSDYAHVLADHSAYILGVEDQEEFRNNLLQKIENDEKDDVLHCALSIMSINHRKQHHKNKGHGISYPDAHRVMISFLQKATKEQMQEMHDRFPHVTPEVLEYVAPEFAEELSA